VFVPLFRLSVPFAVTFVAPETAPAFVMPPLRSHKEDIPELVAAFSAAYPDVAVRLTAHLGASEILPSAILEVAAAQARSAP